MKKEKLYVEKMSKQKKIQYNLYSETTQAK